MDYDERQYHEDRKTAEDKQELAVHDMFVSDDPDPETGCHEDQGTANDDVYYDDPHEDKEIILRLSVYPHLSSVTGHCRIDKYLSITAAFELFAELCPS